jgi:hypothetical protein
MRGPELAVLRMRAVVARTEAVVFLYTSVVSRHVPDRTKEISLITIVCYHILLSRKRIIFATRGLLYPFSLN